MYSKFLLVLVLLLIAPFNYALGQTRINSASNTSIELSTAYEVHARGIIGKYVEEEEFFLKVDAVAKQTECQFSPTRRLA